MRSVIQAGAAVVAALSGVGIAHATILDMRPAGANATSGFLNGAFYLRGDHRAAGSGVINSFVRIASNNTTEQGYNTSGRPLSYDENTSPTFTRDIQFGNLPTVTIGGVAYKEFLLDINQQNSNPYLSLDNVQIFTTAGANHTGLISTLGTPIYNMDVGPDGDSRVDLDYSLNSGSGQTDMAMYIPISLFGSATASTYVTLYSHFGIPFTNNDGYEEWAFQDGGGGLVPLPSAVISGAVSLAGLFGVAVLRHRRSRA